MITVKVHIRPDHWMTGKRWHARFNSELATAMWEAASLVHNRIRRNLSGPSHTRFPGNGNPFPGTLTGRMKNSVTALVRRRQGMIQGVVGPDVHYAVYHETGRGVPKRPFLAPSYKAEKQNVSRIIRQAVKDIVNR